MGFPEKVLVASQDPVFRHYLQAYFSHVGRGVQTCQHPQQLTMLLTQESNLLVVLDTHFLGPDWEPSLQDLFSSSPDHRFLIVIGAPRPLPRSFPQGDPRIQWIRTPLHHTELQEKIQRLLQEGNKEIQKEGLSAPASPEEVEAWAYLDAHLQGSSPAITKVKRLLARVSRTDVTVLLRGESGTGKEVAARAIHHCSPRRNKPFIKVLCAAIPEALLESELFGYEQGAFTGAYRKNPGKFEFAHRGTIFLDEIGDIALPLQAKLLQVLQDGEFSRIGGKEVRVDVRVIAATNRNLEEAVATGSFREDLFYRLNVVTVSMPPLRERREDIPHLVEHFLQKYARHYNKTPPRIRAKDMDRLLEYPWPGNVRELENLIRRMVILDLDEMELPERPISTDPQIVGMAPPPTGRFQEVGSATSASPHSLPDASQEAVPQSRENPTSLDLKVVVEQAIRRAERETILRALEITRWNRRKAARLLGISYKTLLQKIRMYNLEG